MCCAHSLRTYLTTSTQATTAGAINPIHSLSMELLLVSNTYLLVFLQVDIRDRGWTLDSATMDHLVAAASVATKIKGTRNLKNASRSSSRKPTPSRKKVTPLKVKRLR